MFQKPVGLELATVVLTFVALEKMIKHPTDEPCEPPPSEGGQGGEKAAEFQSTAAADRPHQKLFEGCGSGGDSHLPTDKFFWWDGEGKTKLKIQHTVNQTFEGVAGQQA